MVVKLRSIDFVRFLSSALNVARHWTRSTGEDADLVVLVRVSARQCIEESGHIGSAEMCGCAQSSEERVSVQLLKVALTHCKGKITKIYI